MSKRTLPLLLAATIPLAGCGLRDPYSPQAESHPAHDVRSAQTPAPQAAVAPIAGAASVLAHFAQVWANWSAATLAHERAGLLELATGRLAQQLRQDAAQTAKAELQEVSQAYSRGRFVGVIGEDGGRAIVITYEEVAPLGGQAQGAYHVYLARTEHTPHGWRVSEWQPATDS